MNEKLRDIIETKFDDLPNGALFPIMLISQTSDSAASVRDWLGKKVTFGIKVESFDAMVRYLWDIFGDGRIVVTKNEKTFLTIPAFRFAMGSEPTPAGVQSATGFLAESFPLDTDDMKKLQADGSDSCLVAAKLCEEYSRQLKNFNRIDIGEAANIIATALSSGRYPISFISADPSENDFVQRRFFETVSSTANVSVTIIRRDPYDPDIDVATAAKEIDSRFCNVCGRHAEPSAICDIVSTWREDGVPYSDIAVSYPDAAQAYPFLMKELERQHIPFALKFSVPVAKTPLGAAIVSYQDWKSSRDLDVLRELVNSPYTGGTSCYDDVVRFLNEENEKTEEPPELFTHLKDDDEETFIDWMVENGSDDPDLRTEEENIAKTVKAVTASYRAVSAGNLWDRLVADTVSLTRNYGDQGNAVTIISDVMLSYFPAKHVIICGMDLPNSRTYLHQNAFHRPEEVLGLEPFRWTGKRAKKLQVADAIAHAREGGIVFLRNAADANGNELPPGEMFTMLAEAWGGMMGNWPKELPEEKRLSYDEQSLIVPSKPVEIGTKGGRICDGKTIAKMVSIGANGKHTFSPTDLEKAWACPRKWMVGRNGMGYDASTPMTPEDPRLAGTLIHNTLYEYYMSYGKKHARKSLEDQATQQALKQAVDTVLLQEEVSCWLDDSTKTKMAIEKVTKRASQIIDGDCDFAPGFIPMFFEHPAKGDICGLHVRGTVDRVDILPGTKDIVISDYKGTLSASHGWDKKHDMPGLHIQSFLYALMMEQEGYNVVGFVYRSYNDGSICGCSKVDLGPKVKKESVVDAEEYVRRMEIFKEKFGEVAAMFKSGEFVIAPRNNDQGVCQYCPIAKNCSGKVS